MRFSLALITIAALSTAYAEPTSFGSSNKLLLHNNPHHHGRSTTPLIFARHLNSSDSSSAKNPVSSPRTCSRKKNHGQKSGGKSRLPPSPAVASPAAATSTTRASTGLISVTDQSCGETGATETSGPESGPNGRLDWLNCGISKSDPSAGWKPPKIHIDDAVVKDLSECADTLFSACKPFQSLFEDAAKKYNIPAIFLAAFASEESSCNPNASGDNGDAFGLMQITSDKCGGAPNGNCNDPAFNVDRGASYFASLLQQNNGDLLQSLGSYNGWSVGMSFNSATAAANGGCCQCQNNLDYCHQFLNGWAQCIDGNKLASYNNLASCPTN